MNTYTDHQVRRVLSALAAMASRQNCTLLALRHPKKSPSGKAIYQGGGSIGFIGAARSGLLAANDPKDRARQVLASVKSNLGPKPRSVQYEVVSNRKLGVGFIHWIGFTDHLADDLIVIPSARGASEMERAEEWLSKRLAKGRVRSDAIVAEGEAAGFSKRTLDRAKEALGVASEKASSEWHWVLSTGGANV